MKKSFSNLEIVGIVMLALAAAGLTWEAGAESQAERIENAPASDVSSKAVNRIPGDVNRGGQVNAQDIQLVINVLLGLPIDVFTGDIVATPSEGPTPLKSWRVLFQYQIFPVSTSPMSMPRFRTPGLS